MPAAPASPTPAGPPTARRRCTTPTRTSAGEPRRQRGRGRIALVHNGIIENHDELRAELQAQGLRVRQPDRHRGHRPPGAPGLYDGDLLDAVQQRVCAAPAGRLRHRRLLPRRAAPRGRCAPKARRWCWAWATARTSWPPTRWPWPASPTRSCYLEEGDVVDLQLGKHCRISALPRAGRPFPSVDRARCAPCTPTAARPSWAPTGTTCRRRSSSSPRRSPTRWTAWAGSTPEPVRRPGRRSLRGVDRVLILACGTSYYAGTVRAYWLEQIAGIPVHGGSGQRIPLPRRACPTRARWWSPSARAARPPTPWPR